MNPAAMQRRTAGPAAVNLATMHTGAGMDPAAVTRRTFLAVGGLCLLSACGATAAEGKTAPSRPSRVVTPARSAPPPPPLPSPSPSALPVQAKPEYAIAPAKAAGQKVLALTIDDGPDPEWTPKVLEVLREHHVTATFFMIGSSAAAHPDVVRSVAAGGHAIASHTWSHRNLPRLSPAAARTEIERGLDAVTSAAGGVRPSLFRAPYGNWSPVVFAACAELAQRPIAWDVDPRDWDTPGTSRIVSRVLAQTGPRSIILNHDGGGNRAQTVAALRSYLPQLLAGGYHFTSL
jgi:peptidoglycan/xylan/chitin deacetylase (PgdA/CDA1 family)